MIPKFVALCGAPHAGKTEVASILKQRYGAHVVDDGLVLRRGAMALYGLSWEDVSTQEGKDRMVTICGKEYQVRKLLGDLGKMQEAYFGDNFMPDRSIESIIDLNSAPFFVFSSVRMRQGLAHLERGGVVIEITRPGCVSHYDFDQYDKSLVTYTIANDDNTPQWRDVLTSRVDELFRSM